MRQTDQLTGGDDVVFAGAEVRPGRVPFGDEGPDRLDEATEDGRRLGRCRVIVDSRLGAAIGNIQHRHLVGHGARQVAHLIDGHARPHPDAARAHAFDQPVDHEPAVGAVGVIVPLADEVRRGCSAIQKTRPPRGTSLVGSSKTTAPLASGTPSTSTSERTGPI